jgi:hypothetical protein
MPVAPLHDGDDPRGLGVPPPVDWSRHKPGPPSTRETLSPSGTDALFARDVDCAVVPTVGASASHALSSSASAWSAGGAVGSTLYQRKHAQRGPGFSSFLYEIQYRYGVARSSTHLRLNVPDGGLDDPPILVTLVEGEDGGGARVGLTNTQLTDIVAAYLASAAELSANTAMGPGTAAYAVRGAPAMFTLQFNLPGSGAGDLAADGNLKLVEPWNETGADRGGRMSQAAMTAVIAVAVHLIDAAGYSRPWEIIASWSAGLVTAAAYVAAPLRVPVALIDLEGPTNSFARSFTTMCFAGKGEGVAVADPGWLTAAADWLAAYNDTSQYRWKYGESYKNVDRKPYLELAPVAAIWPDGAVPTVWVREQAVKYWLERDAEASLRKRACRHYVRIQGEEDHAQGDVRDEYKNYHAILALEAARVAGSYTFYVATMGGDPQLYSVIVPDTDYQQYPEWPAYEDTFARAQALVDAVRYAALTWV